jgi:hypothetical protein
VTSKLPIEALGGIVEIDLEGLPEDDAAAVHEAWCDALADLGMVERAQRERGGIPPVVRPVDAERTAMLSDLSQRVTLAALEQRRGDLWMLHAAGLAGDDGRVVVLVGPSGRGKTTAVRTLATSFGYVSDESVAIDDEGRVWPYRKPLSVIEKQGAPKAERSPSELGLRALPDAALRVAAVVLLDRVPESAGLPTIETLDVGDALEDLVSQSSGLTSMPAPLRSIAALAGATGGIRRVTYHEAASLRSVVESLLAGSDAAADAVPEGRGAGEGDVSRLAARTSAGRYSRTAFVDALDLSNPDRVAVLRSAGDGTGVLHVLAGVAPALWRAADAASAADLTAAAVAAYGPPGGDADALVEAAADALVETGLLSRT